MGPGSWQAGCWKVRAPAPERGGPDSGKKRPGPPGPCFGKDREPEPGKGRAGRWKGTRPRREAAKPCGEALINKMLLTFREVKRECQRQEDSLIYFRQNVIGSFLKNVAGLGFYAAQPVSLARSGGCKWPPPSQKGEWGGRPHTTPSRA